MEAALKLGRQVEPMRSYNILDADRPRISVFL